MRIARLLHPRMVDVGRRILFNRRRRLTVPSLCQTECRSGLGLGQPARRQQPVNRHSEAHFGIELSGVRQAKIGKHIARTDFHRFTASASLAHIAPDNRAAALSWRSMSFTSVFAVRIALGVKSTPSLFQVAPVCGSNGLRRTR